MYLQVDISVITKSIYIVSGIFVLIVLLLIFFVILYRKSHNYFLKEKELMNAQFDKALLQSQIEVQERTFTALGKELHDNIGQLLSSTKMLLGITQRSLPEIPDTLITAEETLGKAINELRALSKSLTKEWLEQFNLIENLQSEVERINSANEFHIFLSSPQTLYLPSDKQIILFRIIQEGLQNAIKHADAKNITITITEDNTATTANIKDDGTGFEETKDVKGIGLMNMKHRIKLLNGQIRWHSKPGDGTLVNIVLPVNQAEL